MLFVILSTLFTLFRQFSYISRFPIGIPYMDRLYPFHSQISFHINQVLVFICKLFFILIELCYSFDCRISFCMYIPFFEIFTPNWIVIFEVYSYFVCQLNYTFDFLIYIPTEMSFNFRTILFTLHSFDFPKKSCPFFRSTCRRNVY